MFLESGRLEHPYEWPHSLEILNGKKGKKPCMAQLITSVHTIPKIVSFEKKEIYAFLRFSPLFDNGELVETY